MATQSKAVVVDSSALVALLKLDDVDNRKAVNIMDDVIVKRDLLAIIPNEVLAESLNIIGKKLGRKQEVSAGNLLLGRISRGEVLLVPATADTVRAALYLGNSTTGNPSFVDRLVMALADEYQTRLVFGFDGVFRKNGYKLPS